MVRVLVVEDEANIREMIALNLRLAGMEAVEAESAEAALPLLEQKPGCDAAILDVMLPGMNGFSLCETIRRTDQKIGIIILSAKGQEQDKIKGLSIGADDYMTKPFSVSELLARRGSLWRRDFVCTKYEKPCSSACTVCKSGNRALLFWKKAGTCPLCQGLPLWGSWREAPERVICAVSKFHPEWRRPRRICS